MSNSTFIDSAVSDESVQRTHIARLKRWVKRVSRRESQVPMCEAISKLIDLGLLRYGTWPASFGLKTAFAAVRQSDEMQRFLDDCVALVTYVGSLMLGLFITG